MRKIILITCFSCFTVIANAQSCPGIEGLTPVPLKFGTNVYGFPESVLPIVPLYWNRFYTVDPTTGQLNPSGCVYTGDPNIHSFAGCACILPGIYFRSVTDVCDPTPCGGDAASLPQLPITNNNNSSNTWSQAATWVTNQVPDMSSALSAMITKTTQIDADISLSNTHWLVLAAGSSSILPGTTVTCNSVIQIYPAASLENSGILKGTGQIFGSLTNNGTLSPGNSPGKFTIAGNYTATATAVHQIEIAAANLYDTINIVNDNISPATGAAILDGTLNVSLINGFMPSLGDTFRICMFTSSTGAFAHKILPALPAGLHWSVEYNSTNISLAVVNTVALPLIFVNTSAYRKNSGVEVDWSSENENNVKEYTIEKSADGIYFNKAGVVNAKGAGANHYNWFDASPATGDNYYRIKAIDLDGQSMYSAILFVKITENNKVAVYPNPAKRGATIRLDLQNNTATKMEIINAAGQVLYSKADHLTGNIMIPVSLSWPAGQYLVRVINGDKVVTQKIMVY